MNLRHQPYTAASGQQFSQSANLTCEVVAVRAEFIKNIPAGYGDDQRCRIWRLAKLFGSSLLADQRPGVRKTLQQNRKSKWQLRGRARNNDPRSKVPPLIFLPALMNILAGPSQRVDEGYFDGGTMFWTGSTRNARRKLGIGE